MTAVWKKNFQEKETLSHRFVENICNSCVDGEFLERIIKQWREVVRDPLPKTDKRKVSTEKRYSVIGGWRNTNQKSCSIFPECLQRTAPTRVNMDGKGWISYRMQRKYEGLEPTQQPTSQPPTYQPPPNNHQPTHQPNYQPTKPSRKIKIWRHYTEEMW